MNEAYRPGSNRIWLGMGFGNWKYGKNDRNLFLSGVKSKWLFKSCYLEPFGRKAYLHKISKGNACDQLRSICLQNSYQPFLNLVPNVILSVSLGRRDVCKLCWDLTYSWFTNALNLAADGEHKRITCIMFSQKPYLSSKIVIFSISQLESVS